MAFICDYGMSWASQQWVITGHCLERYWGVAPPETTLYVIGTVIRTDMLATPWCGLNPWDSLRAILQRGRPLRRSQLSQPDAAQPGPFYRLPLSEVKRITNALPGVSSPKPKNKRTRRK